MKSLFFNSIDGDRKYNANDFTRYFSSILSNGVFLNGSNNFKVSAENGMNIIINKGYGNINGNLFFEDSQTRIELPTSHLQKYYIILIRLDYLEREVVITYKETQDINNLQRDEGIYELCLALISVPPSEINILDENITDTRPNAEVCGFVNSLITVDGEELFTQFESEFNNWFDGVKGVFGEDIAGNLLNLINKNKNEISTIRNSFGVSDGIATLDRDGLLNTNQIKKLPISVIKSVDTFTGSLELNGLELGGNKRNIAINIYTDVSSSRSLLRLKSNGNLIFSETLSHFSPSYCTVNILINNEGDLYYRINIDNAYKKPFKIFKKAIKSESNNISITSDAIFMFDILEV